MQGGYNENVPAEWLPNAPVWITAIYEHDDFDTMATRVTVARDWEQRGDDYVLRMLDAAEGSRLVAVFEGAHYAKLGYAIPE